MAGLITFALKQPMAYRGFLKGEEGAKTKKIVAWWRCIVKLCFKCATGEKTSGAPF